MVDPIAAAGLEPAQVSTATGVNSPQASQHSVRDFAAAMERQGGANAPAGAEAAGGVQDVKPAGGGFKTMMAAFDRLNVGADSIREVANRMAANPQDASPSQIFELTMKCHEFMFQTQLTSNVANRTSDGIQQLFRQQS